MTYAKLVKATLRTAAPFLLSLTEQDLPVYCEKIVRSLPNKRLVAFGTWNEQPVVVKLFYDSSGLKRHYERELAGIESLLSSGVPTPRILFHGPLFDKRAYVFVFEKITDACDLNELWQQKSSPEELMPIMQAMTLELATQHVLGIMQRDLHLKNFLLKGKNIYTLDGGSIETFHALLPKKKSIDHLALFFSELGVGMEFFQHSLFQVYGKSRGWMIKPADIQLLNASIKKWNKKRKNQYQKKIQRNSSLFTKIKTSKSLVIYRQDYFSETFQKLLDDPEIVFNNSKREILKAGRSSTVIKMTIDNRILVIKRYNMKNAWHWMRRALRKTRAAESFRLANLLRLFGVATAKPIAFIEKRLFGLRNTSYFIMEYVEGPTLSTYFSNYQSTDFHCEKIAARVVDLLRKINEMQMSHGDLKATNIVIEDDQPVLLDLDGMTEHKTQNQTNRIYKKEIKRFMENWKDQPTVKTLFEKWL